MGQQASQLERGDLEGIYDELSRSQSPSGDLRQHIKPDHDSSQQSPESVGDNNASSQDFAFSSQVPFSPGRRSRSSKKRGRTSASKFEQSSQSPEPATLKADPEVNSPDQDRNIASPKATKRKRSRSKKKQSLIEHDPQEDEVVADSSMGKNAAASELVRTSDPKSSMDFDAMISSPTTGEASHLGDTNNEQSDNAQLQGKRERKERRKAKKAAKQAEQLRASLLAANPSFGTHDDPDAMAQTNQSNVDNTAAEDNMVEDPTDGLHGLTSLSSKGSARTNPEVPMDSKNTTDDGRPEDPNQLPTPDDEGQHSVAALAVSQPEMDDASDIHPSAQQSTRKRKAKDSDKKSRKRQREEESDSAVKDANEESVDATTAATTSASPSVVDRSPSISAIPGSTSRIGHLARDYYNKRYVDKRSSTTPTKLKTMPLSSQRLKLAGLSPLVADDSPSAARLQRQEARSSSARRSESTGVDANERPGSRDSNGDIVMADADASNLGSDDLGAAINDSDERQVPESPAEQISAGAKSKTRATRQYGSKTSTAKKRQAKPSYLDRAEDDQDQENSEMPSPAIAAASRKGKGKGKARAKPVPKAEADESAEEQQGTDKQPKITSLMKTASSSVASTSQRPSATPASTARPPQVPKKAGKAKNPTPENEITGPFTGAENNALAKIIEVWRKNHDQTKEQINDMVQKNPQEHKTHEFWDYIREACPNRKRQKIINQVRRTHHNFSFRATWTKEQHDELCELYEVHGRDYKIIGGIINRHPQDIRDRIRNYVVCGKNRRSDLWDHQEEAKLISILNEAFVKIKEIKVGAPAELQEQDDEELVDWHQVSENMGLTRSRLQCQVKWKQLRLRMEGGNIDGKAGHSMEDIIRTARETFKTMTDKDLVLVCKAIKKSGTLAESRIGWHRLRQQWWAMEQWNRPALMLAWHRLRRAVPDWKTMNVPEICKFQMDKFEQTGKVQLLPEDQMDMDAETREMEHRVGKIIRNAKAPKSSHFAVKSDEEDSEEDDGEDDGEAPEEDVVDTGRPQRLDLDAHDKDESVDDVQVPEAEKKTRARRSSQKVRPTIEQSPEMEPNVEQQDTPASPEVQKKQPKKKRAVAKPSTKPSRARKSKGTKASVPAEQDEEASSDTDADDVEDIPAVLPE